MDDEFYLVSIPFIQMTDIHWSGIGTHKWTNRSTGYKYLFYFIIAVFCGGDGAQLDAYMYSHGGASQKSNILRFFIVHFELKLQLIK